MIQHQVTVVENVALAERTYRMRVVDPEIGRWIRPGQFVMLRVPGGTDPLLGRPFALYDTVLDAVGKVSGYDIVYLVVGRVTTAMSQLRCGDLVEIWGPLGNGFNLQPTRHLVMVAGGIGQTPFLAVARDALGTRRYGCGPDSGEWGNSVPLNAGSKPAIERVTMCYGVRNERYLAGLDDFRAAGVELAIATDDGSAGVRGFVTDLVRNMIESTNPPTQIIGCGPEAMMRTLAGITNRAGIPCELSLETPMACGIGACFSCVARIRQDDGEPDYRRVCVEGPVFDAARVVF